MTFDERISETVPLSKILDCFIEDEEKPSTILWFLKEHKDCIDDILTFSEYSERLFFLDFIAKCSYDESVEMMKLMKNINSEYFGRNGNDLLNIYLVWQILQSNLPERIKNVFRPYLTLTKPPKHPYGGHSKGSYIVAFDNIFTDVCENVYSIAEKINSIRDDVFDNICFSLENSLFVKRIYQKDLFLLLDIKKQFLLLNEIRIRGVREKHMNFFRQMLNSDVDVEIKYYIYSIFKSEIAPSFSLRNLFRINSDLMDLVRESKNFSQLMLKLDLYGVDNYAGELFFYLLYTDNTKWLFEVQNYNPDMLKEHFDIDDLLEKIRRDGNKD